MSQVTRATREREIMKKHGIKYPTATQRAARKHGVPLSLLCSVLVQETGGGHNVFGHDLVKRGQIRGGEVTKRRYLTYKKNRKAGLGMQGVGPMQLTWWELQDKADKQGGCWRPNVNIDVGTEHLAGLIKQYGVAAGVARYNGSGPAARLYSIKVRARARLWHRRFVRGTR